MWKEWTVEGKVVAIGTDAFQTAELCQAADNVAHSVCHIRTWRFVVQVPKHVHLTIIRTIMA